MKTEEIVALKAKEMARELKDECDGSYVGAEMEKTENINGKDIKIEVCAFWESTNHYSFSASGDDFESSGNLLEF